MRATPRQLSATERHVRSAFQRGLEVDLRGPLHPIRAGALADLLARPVDRAAHPRAALRLRHATIVGGLDLRHAEITVPVSISQSTFSEVPDLTEARGVSLLLADCALPGLRARLLELRGDLSLERCAVTGLVDLRDARLGGALTLNGSRLTYGDEVSVGSLNLEIQGRITFAAQRMIVTGSVSARAAFSANGQVALDGAKVGGNVDFDGAALRNPEGPALTGDRLVVAGSFTARDGFTADGDVALVHAQIGNQLNFINATLRAPGDWALHLGGAKVGSLWLLFAVPPDGRVRLSGLQADSIFDNPSTWPASLELIGCTYRLLSGRTPTATNKPSPQALVTIRQRLDWLRRSPDGFAPQPYEQLADFYRRSGQEAEARRVQLDKHRRRRTTLPLLGRLFGYVLDGLVGYGYRTWLAGIWLAVFWALGTLTFMFRPAIPRNPAEAPAPNAALQSLDLLLPIVNLGHDGAWITSGISQYVAVLLVLVGWVLTAAVVAGVTRVFNR